MAGELRVQLRQLSPTTTEAGMGAHHVLVDRPVAKGGADLGPMGGELFLAAVGGCFMSNLLAAIRTRDSQISGIRIEVIGAITDTPPRFESLDLAVSADGSDLESLPQLLEIAGRGCIMMNTLRGKLDVRIRIVGQ